MDNHDHGCKKIGRRLAVLCAFFGAVAAVLMAAVMGLRPVGLLALQVEVVVGLIVLFLAAGWLGTMAGSYLCQQGCRDGIHVLIGISIAFGSITLSVLSGSFTHTVISVARGTPGGANLQFVWYVPLFMILVVGSIPAAALGVLYGYLVKKELANIDYYV